MIYADFFSTKTSFASRFWIKGPSIYPAMHERWTNHKLIQNYFWEIKWILFFCLVSTNFEVGMEQTKWGSQYRARDLELVGAEAGAANDPFLLWFYFTEIFIQLLLGV